MKKLLISAILITVGMIIPARITIADDGMDTNEWTPIHGELMYCDNSESIVFDGLMHTVSDYQVMTEGYKWRYHINLSIDGIGTLTGDKFILNEAINQVVIVNALPTSNLFTRSMILIGQGSVQDLHIHVTFHLIIDKDFNTKVLIDHFTRVCN